MKPQSNPMRDQILAAPDALAASIPAIEQAARLILTTPEIYRTRRIVLTGSGDSLFAAKAAELALIAHSGLPVEVRPPIEAGRYHATLSLRGDVENTLVIAISNSGAAARVCEAAALWRSRGATVLALTSSTQSLLAANADHVFALPALTLPTAPGFVSFALPIIALLLLAVRLGEVRMAITQDNAKTLRQALNRHVGDLRRVVGALDQPARAVATRLGDTRLFEFAGAGPDYGASAYGAAKMLEASGRHAFACDLEEWTHLNYFDGAPEEIATFVTMARGSRAESRAIELVAFMAKLGRMIVLVGGGAAAEAVRDAKGSILPVGDDVPEIWSPLILGAPLALVAAHFAELQGAEYGRGAKGRWADCADASTVQKSAIWKGGP